MTIGAIGEKETAEMEETAGMEGTKTTNGETKDGTATKEKALHGRMMVAVDDAHLERKMFGCLHQFPSPRLCQPNRIAQVCHVSAVSCSDLDFLYQALPLLLQHHHD